MSVPALQNTAVLFRRILAQFPQDIRLAFAYGSGVFKQQGTSQGQMGVRQNKLIQLTLVSVMLFSQLVSQASLSSDHSTGF